MCVCVCVCVCVVSKPWLMCVVAGRSFVHPCLARNVRVRREVDFDQCCDHRCGHCCDHCIHHFYPFLLMRFGLRCLAGRCLRRLTWQKRVSPGLPSTSALRSRDPPRPTSPVPSAHSLRPRTGAWFGVVATSFCVCLFVSYYVIIIDCDSWCVLGIIVAISPHVAAARRDSPATDRFPSSMSSPVLRC